MLSSGILPYDIGTITYVWKITMHLKDEIAPEILAEAVAAAATRYPYFMKRLVRRGESHVIVDNDLAA